MTDEEIDRDIDWLLFNPDKTKGAQYHDAGSCWQLIEGFRRRLAACEMRDETDVRNTGADIAADLLAEIARSGKHPGAFGGEAMEAAAQAILEIHRRADQAIANALRVQRRGEGILKAGMVDEPVDSAAIRRAALIEAMMWLDEQPYPGEYRAGAMAKHFGLPEPTELYEDDKEGTDELHPGS